MIFLSWYFSWCNPKGKWLSLSKHWYDGTTSYLYATEMKMPKAPKGISLSLAYSIERILHKFNCYQTKSISIPDDSSIALKEKHGWAHVSAEILSINRFTSTHFQQD